MRGVKKVKEMIGGEVLGFDVREEVAMEKMLMEVEGREKKGKLGGKGMVGVCMGVGGGGG
ncbi:hypothetical protein [Bacillus sp. WP8]|uniref:hypothetical protein n=1 Tax=Bacillus sp. WP8 TaxID=756828 RepID=UPI0037C116D8